MMASVQTERQLFPRSHFDRSLRANVGAPMTVDNLSTTMASSSSDAAGIEESAEMPQITINEGLAWLKTLKKRHEELLALRRR